ncbi:MAG: G5 domain-containing protein [Rhodoglobus sp.]
MTTMQPGWFTDPSDSSKLRWWDGSSWSDNVARDGAVWREALPARPPAPSAFPVAPKRMLPVWAWIALGVAGLIAILLIPSLVPLAALTALVTGIVALVKKTPTWLRLKSRSVALTVTASAAALLLVSGVVTANTTPAVPQGDALVGAVPLVSDEDAGESAQRTVPAPSSTPTPTPTPTPSPTPRISTRDETATEPVAFERVSVEDGSFARGTTQITTGGADGEKTLTYRVTLSDGKEVKRELLSEVVTREPVAEVTSLGTYDAPPPPAPEASGCDPNYADACVPIASDVDCAWGTGNGPAYFDGVALVVGSDIYDLDRDGDGYACEQ